LGDALAAPGDVVSALLQDPLVDTPESRNLLLRRDQDMTGDHIQLRWVSNVISGDLTDGSYGAHGSRSLADFSIPSSFLQASGYDIVEVKSKSFT
jgi:hypothetical protein